MGNRTEEVFQLIIVANCFSPNEANLCIQLVSPLEGLHSAIINRDTTAGDGKGERMSRTHESPAHYRLSSLSFLFSLLTSKRTLDQLDFPRERQRKSQLTPKAYQLIIERCSSSSEAASEVATGTNVQCQVVLPNIACPVAPVKDTGNARYQALVLAKSLIAFR